MRRGLSISFFVLLALIPVVWAADTKGPADLQSKMTEINNQVARLQQDVGQLEQNYTKEVDERDRLMLRRSFVEGREFFFELHDYSGACEVFYGIVNHPLAKTLPNYIQAVYYLAESLFQSKYYAEAKSQFETIYRVGKSEYYGISLIRLIEIAVNQRNYSEAERLYAVMLSQFPEEEDGSLGRYIIGKSYYRRGETAKAVEIFDSIPETGNYYATAQYFTGVLFVKQKNYKEAVNRFRRMKKSLTFNQVNQKKLSALANLALGRIYYELNDFPQAMANYMAVPGEDSEYPEALYESIWVFITRNDYLLKAIEDERTNYEDILFQFAEFQDRLASEEDQASLTAMMGETDKLQGDLDSMKTTFNEIDTSLARLQEEALASFNKMIKAAPNHALIPEAELLVGNLYAQVEDFKAAEEWYTQIKRKYENYYASIQAVAKNLTSADQIALLNEGSKMATGEPLNPMALRGLPPEVAYWLANDPDMAKIFAFYRAVQKERENLDKMNQLVYEIESKIAAMERGGEYPVLREARRQSDEYKSAIQTLQVNILNVKNQAAGEGAGQAELMSKAGAMEQALFALREQLVSLDSKMDVKKSERMAVYRQELATLRTPLANYQPAVDSLMARVGNATAMLAAQEMDQIERQVRDYAQRADLGIIDVAWRATRGSSREIKKYQQQMEEDLRKLRKQEKPEPAGATPPSGQQPSPTPQPPSQPPAAPEPKKEEPPPAPTGGGEGK